MKLSKEQQELLENELKNFMPIDALSDALEYDNIRDLNQDVIDTYGYDLIKLSRVMYGRGLSEVRTNMVVLAQSSPSALSLLYKDLEHRGILGSDDQEDGGTSKIVVEVVDGGEEDNSKAEKPEVVDEIPIC